MHWGQSLLCMIVLFVAIVYEILLLLSWQLTLLFQLYFCDDMMY